MHSFRNIAVSCLNFIQFFLNLVFVQREKGSFVTNDKDSRKEFLFEDVYG